MARHAERVAPFVTSRRLEGGGAPRAGRGYTLGMTTRPRTALADTVLDRTVILGWSRAGYRLRQRHWGATEPAPGALAGRHVVLTGATSGLGEAAAHELARLGAVVHLVGRNPEKTQRVADEIRAAVPDADLVLHRCDVSDLDSVRTLGEELRGSDVRVHALLHNAGVMSKQRSESPQGHELTLATHVLGPFLLTRMLADRLTPDGRVVFMASGGMYAQAVVPDDLEHRRGYNGTVAYARTKRMQVDLTPVWNHHLPGDATAHAMHPGWADTPGVAEQLPGFRKLTQRILRTPAEGADTLAWLAASSLPAHHGGAFWQDRAPRPTAYLGRNATAPHDVRALWRYCVQATDGWTEEDL